MTVFLRFCDGPHPLRRSAFRHGAAKTHQRVEGVDLAPLDQFGAAVALRPVGQPLERELGTQAQPARFLRQQTLNRGGQPLLRVEVVDQDDLPARLEHARTFRQHALGIFHQR